MANASDPITITLSIRAKWWMRPAIELACIALALGLIRDKDSPEHWGGKISAEERVAKWLAGFAFAMEVR